MPPTAIYVANNRSTASKASLRLLSGKNLRPILVGISGVKCSGTILATVLALTLCACAAQPSESAPANSSKSMGLTGKYPPEAERNYALARVIWRSSDICPEPLKALEYLDKAIESAPNYAEAYLRRGMAKSDLRQWEDAFDDITRAILLKPVAENYAFRGLVSMRSGNFKGARMDFNRSIKLAPAQYRAWNYRGKLNLLLENYADACSDFANGCSNGDCSELESAKEHKYCR